MVSGDVVNFLANSAISYVPAVGVEIIILQVFYNQTTNSSGLTDGATNAIQYVNAAVGGLVQYQMTQKLGITNTNYFTISPSSANVGFSGIQIK